MAYRIGEKLSVGGGVSALYTIFNEKIAVNQGAAGDGKVKGGEGKWGHAISASALWLGDGQVDQTSQGARFKGEFESNWLFIIGANLQYRF